MWYGLIGLTGVGTCSDVFSVFGCGDCGRCFLFVDLLLLVGWFLVFDLLFVSRGVVFGCGFVFCGGVLFIPSWFGLVVRCLEVACGIMRCELRLVLGC